MCPVNCLAGLLPPFRYVSWGKEKATELVAKFQYQARFYEEQDLYGGQASLL